MESKSNVKPRRRAAKSRPETQICCLVNQRSGTAGESPGVLVKKLFAERGAAVRIIELKSGDDIQALTKQVTADGFGVIVSGGGDGTINAVASAIVGKANIKFGVLPMGTYNHFAKDLVIPLDLEHAVDVILQGVTRPIDVGEVNGHIFVNNSSLGAYPAMVKLREALQKSGYAKKWAALRASIQVLAHFRLLRVTLKDATGNNLTTKTAMLFVGNNRYELDPVNMGTRNTLDDGRLWILIANAQSRLALFFSLFAVLWHRDNASAVTVFETGECVVNTRKASQKVSVDGEVLLLATPLRYRIRPAALHIIVPAA